MTGGDEFLRIAYREKSHAKCAAYYAMNQEIVLSRRIPQREATRHGATERTAKWAVENKDHLDEWRHSPIGRLSRKKAAAKTHAKRKGHGDLDMGGFIAKCADLQWVCQLCGKILMPETVTIDHIVPIVHGGTNDLENLQPLCLHCNCKKSARPMKEMLGSPFLFGG
jgi:5-methylcytosine-specific restriction endonuclease McrA